ncbi:MAG: L-histidine N(alpha)-methyltransferase, partial [Pseudomonadota bacterium]
MKLNQNLPQGLQLFDDLPAVADVKNEVLDGLAKPQKTLPAKYFYDERGSQLFEAITQLPEYYLTRTEIQLLRQYGADIAERVGQGAVLMEYGSGASIKIRLLLEALRPDCYVPMDISRDFLISSANKLLDDYPWLSIYAGCVDYSQPVELPRTLEQASNKLGFFPGSSMGNFTPAEAQAFLRRVRTTLGDGSHFLLGVDLDKSPEILHAAYNDAQGVTAAFNKNILRHLNRSLRASFDENLFEHEARVNQSQSRVEMHLVSRIDQMIHIAGTTLVLRKGESLHTENSYKYRLESLEWMA